MKLPIFPNFKPLELSDKEEIETFTSQYPLISDYHFPSLWSWNIEDKIMICDLNNNLVVKFYDYVTGEPFYSFLGIHSLEETISALIKKSQQENMTPKLKFISEFIVTKIKDLSKLDIAQDPDNDDYILSIENLVSMNGSALYTKLKELRKFKESPNLDYEVRIFSIVDPFIQKEIMQVFGKWRNSKGASYHDTRNEHMALTRLLNKAHIFRDSEVLAVYINNVIEGFLIFDRIQNNWTSMNSFQKANSHVRGINEFINYAVASYLKLSQFVSMNIQQDLGIASLRQAKKAYNPTFLKKYIISQK